MTDTIELLETIGKDAKLRCAPSEELARTLELRGASDALKAAVISEDSSHLSAEFGHKPQKVDHNTTGPAHEEESDDDNGKHIPPPSKPDQDQPSHDR
jgi:hypothetical protein